MAVNHRRLIATGNLPNKPAHDDDRISLRIRTNYEGWQVHDPSLQGIWSAMQNGVAFLARLSTTASVLIYIKES